MEVQPSIKHTDVADAVADHEATAAGDGPRERGRSQRTGAGGGRRSRRKSVPDGACPSLTHHQTRQVEDSCRSELSPVLAFDWWEVAGCVEHGKRAKEFFDEIERTQQLAESYRKEQPLHLGDDQVFVFARGMGTGRGARFEVRLEWLGATIGLSTRGVANRQLPNFYLKIPGEACVLRGAKQLHQQVLAFLGEFDFVLTDSWFRRFDVCLDLPGWGFGEYFAPACEAKQYFGSGTRSAPYREGIQTTGFSVKTGALELAIYDKLQETCSKKSEAYLNAMVLNRWGGQLPEAATRIEYRIYREMLSGLGLNTVDRCLEALPSLISKVSRFDEHPFFVLTDCVPDRKGRHQDRACVHPDWKEAIEKMRKLAGEPLLPLKHLDRSMMGASRCMQNAVGYVLTAAAQLGHLIEGKEDIIAVFTHLLTLNQITDDEIAVKWGDKARRAGTFETVSKFPFGNNLAA